MLRYVWRAGAHNKRLRARRVDEAALAATVHEEARTSGTLRAKVVTGGTVCNSYGYKADTEAVLVVSNGYATVVFMSRVPANKATLCGAANACVPGSGFIWHGRLSDNEALTAGAWDALRAAFEDAFTPLELLAATGDA